MILQAALLQGTKLLEDAGIPAPRLTGEVLLKDSHLFGVFAALRDPDLFRQVGCENGFVEWPGDIDLAPDAMCGGDDTDEHHVTWRWHRFS